MGGGWGRHPENVPGGLTLAERGQRATPHAWRREVFMMSVPPLRSHPHLYEINTWVWLEELSRREGQRVTLGRVPDREWDRLQGMGFDLVWLMGVWRRSLEGRRIAQTDRTLFPGYEAALPGWQPDDVVGSAYAVQAYEPDRRVGTWEELDVVRAKLHARGMRLVLDFVPNHTARDHTWITAHPEYYVCGDDRSLSERPSEFFLPPGEVPRRPIAHGRDPYFPPWSDSAQLNYLNPATRAAMVGELRRTAQHCDGVRCDMAMLELNRIFVDIWGGCVGDWSPPEREFWADARQAVPGLILIAEAYWDLEWELQRLGFDFTNDKRLYDRLREGQARDIRGHLGAEMEYQRKLVRFLENHDEPRSAEVFGAERIKGAATLVATLPGMRFYHQGQLEGRHRRPPVQLARAAEEPPDERCIGLYDHLLRLTGNDIFHRGSWRLLVVVGDGDDTHENLIAYEWRLGETWKIVVVNVSDGVSGGILPLSGGLPRSAEATREVRLFDEIGQVEQHIQVDDVSAQALPLRLSPFQAVVWSVSS